MFGSNGDAWGEDEEKDYYNDRAGAQPPSPPHYATNPSNLPVSDGVYNSIKNPERKPTDSFMGFENNFVYDNKGTCFALSLSHVCLVELHTFVFLAILFVLCLVVQLTAEALLPERF